MNIDVIDTGYKPCFVSYSRNPTVCWSQHITFDAAESMTEKPVEVSSFDNPT